MRINNNISAVITNKQLLRTEDSLSDAMERLSSGMRINHSKDDPSGMAISGKMDSQIEGLDMASRNANDGISIIQSADGALKEVTDMMQRMRELSVQAANDTNAPADREAIQDEIRELKEEVDRVSSTTEFNTRELLDGSLDARVYGDHVSREQVSAAVTPGIYKLKIDEAATRGKIEGEQTDGPVPEGAGGTISINDQKILIQEGMSGEEAFEALRAGAELGDVTVEKEGNKLTFLSGITTDGADEVLGNAYGADSKIKFSVDNPALASYFGLSASGESPVSAKVTLGEGFSESATAAVDGRHVTITDTEGFQMDFLLDGDASDPTKSYAGDLSIEVTTLGPMTLQIGANENQTMAVRVPSTSSTSLYLDQVDVRTKGGADRSIALLDNAITRISQIRADLGANQNRLEHTTASLDSTSENMTQAMSRISDADMAKEMTEYTKQNVLQQAATSVLSQANEIPQMALQLLQ